MTTQIKPTRRGRPSKTNLTRANDKVMPPDVEQRAHEQLNGTSPTPQPNFKLDEQSPKDDLESTTKEEGQQTQADNEVKVAKPTTKKPRPEPKVIPPVDDPMVNYMRQCPQLYKVIKDEAGFAQFDISDLAWPDVRNVLDSLPIGDDWLVAMDVDRPERIKETLKVGIFHGNRIYVQVEKKKAITYLENCADDYRNIPEMGAFQDIIAAEKPSGLSFKAIEGFVFGKFFGGLNFRVNSCGFREVKQKFLDRIEYLAKNNPNCGVIYADYLRYHTSNEHLDIYLLTQMELLIQEIYPQLSYLDSIRQDMRTRVPRVQVSRQEIERGRDYDRCEVTRRRGEYGRRTPFWMNDRSE